MAMLDTWSGKLKKKKSKGRVGLVKCSALSLLNSLSDYRHFYASMFPMGQSVASSCA